MCIRDSHRAGRRQTGTRADHLERLSLPAEFTTLNLPAASTAPAGDAPDHLTARIRPAYAAALVAFVVTAFVSQLRSTPYNNFVLLAQALLAGHTWIDWPGAFIDALPYNGHYFVIEGPLPALLLVPLVALFGARTNQTGLALVLAAVAIGAAWELGERFGVRRTSIAWILSLIHI